MKAWAPQSLAARATLWFALIACLVVSGLGLYLYSSVRQALEVRADYTLVGRVERFRTMLQDLYNVRQMEERPAIFESMLGNEQDVRIFRRVGEAPFIHVNPDNMTPPAMTPVPVGTPLGITALHEGRRHDGVRVQWVSALAEIGGSGGTVEITAAYVMTQESRMLSAYLLRVVGAIVLAILLSTIMGFLLMRRGLQPLARMSRRAAEITPANLAVRLPQEDAPAELRQAIAAFNAMLDRLQAGYESLSQFSADLAHEIRTPINVLMGQTQVALGQVRSAEEYEQLLESNLEEFTRLAHMVENILFLARADHADAQLERGPLALPGELRKIADYFEGLAHDRGMHFDVQASGTGHANAIMWRRAINNLVINAIRYGQPGTCIRLAAHGGPQGSTVEVENLGAPLSQDQVDRMFSRFYRGDRSRSQHTESNGLGLALVKAIMALHGGTATASVTGQGRISFRLYFPAPHAREPGRHPAAS